MSNINNSSEPKEALEKKKKNFFRNLRNVGAWSGILGLLACLVMGLTITDLKSRVTSQEEIIKAMVSGLKDNKESFAHAKWMIFEKEQGIHIASASQLDGSALNTKIVDELIKSLNPGKVKVLRNYTGLTIMPFAHILAYYENENDLYAEQPPPAKIMIVIPATQTIDNYAQVNSYNSLSLFEPSSIKDFEKRENISIVSISSLNDHSMFGNGAFDGIRDAIIKDENSAFTSVRGWYKGYMPTLKEKVISNLEDVFGVNDSTLLIAYTTTKDPGRIFFMLLQSPTGLG